MISLSSTLAIAALILGLAAYFSKDSKRLRIVLFVQAILLATHFMLEGSISASIVTFAIAPLNLLSAFRNTKPFYPLFAGLILLAGAAGYSGPQDLFPIAAVTLSLFALYNLEDLKMRMSLMCCSLMWIIHDVAYNLPIILVMDVILFVSNAIAVGRMIKEAQENSQRSASDEVPETDAS